MATLSPARLRWAIVLMGAWAAGSLVVSFVASENFFTVDRLIGARPNPAFAAIVGQLGPAQARELLRYLASELNRFYFDIWNAAQLVCGMAVLALIRGRAGVGTARAVVAGMLAIVLVMIVGLAPEIKAIGRSLDFVPRTPPPPALRTFGLLHAAYVTLEIVKLAAAITAAWLMIRVDALEDRWQEQPFSTGR